MRRIPATTTGRLMLTAVTLGGATILATAATVPASVPASAATPRHATSGWGGTSTGHGSTFGQPATAGPVSSHANLNAWVTNGDVKASVFSGGVLYIGGTFTQLVSPDGSTTLPAEHVAALSASTGQPINGFSATVDDGEVDALALSPNGSRIYVGGAFTHSGGVYAGHVMAIDPITGVRDTSWHGSTTWPVYALTTAGSQVFVGGGPNHVVTGPTSTYLTSLDAAGGGATAGFNPPLIDNEPYHTTSAAMTDGWITALAVSSDARLLYVGGYINRVGGTVRPSLAALSTTTGSWVTTFAPHSLKGGVGHAGNDVLQIIATPKQLYAGVGGTANLLFDYDPWIGGSARFLNRTDGDVQALALIGRTLYLGGHFHNFVSDATGYHYNGMTVYGHVVNITFAARVDAFSGQLDTSWQPSVGNWQDPAAYFGVYTMSTDGHNLYAGGAFDKVNAQPHPHVAYFAGP